ncbi:TPA: hypothetical protein GXZ54_05825 [bacterium]|nr:hypothetical protein [bacterium]
MKDVISTIIVSGILLLCVIIVIFRVRKNKGCHCSCGSCEKSCFANFKDFLKRKKDKETI